MGPIMSKATYIFISQIDRPEKVGYTSDHLYC